MRAPRPLELDPAPMRPLTSRECAQVINGIIMALCEYCDVATVRHAVRYLAGTEQIWKGMELIAAAGRKLRGE